MPSSVNFVDTFPSGEGLERFVQMVYIRTGFVCLPPFFLSFVTFSAPSVRDGVRDAMRLAEFSRWENILHR